MNNKLVDYPNGAKVPADEPAVAAARAAHLNKKATIAASAPRALVSHANGAVVPADEPAVAAARAAHLRASAGAASAPAAANVYGYSGAAASAPAGSGYGYSGPLNMNNRLVDYPNGAKVPADEPAVAAARAAHLSARAGAAPSAPAGSGYGYSGPLNMNNRLV